MPKKLNPDGVPKPGSPYSQGVEVEAGARWLHVSGQIGVDAGGKVVEGIEGQLEQIWKNILGVLAAAGMGPHDLVKFTTFLTRKDDIALSRKVRVKMLDGAEPASTLLVVSALASPEILAEIEAVAAKK